MNNYLKMKQKRIIETASKIDNNEIDIRNLEDDLIDELISFYNKRINIKKQYIRKIRKRGK